MTTLNPPQGAVAASRARRRPFSFYLGWGLLYAVLVVGALLFALPLVWMLSSSVKPGYQVYAMPPQWIPDTLIWDGYIEPWKKFAMGTFYRNTLILVIANTVLTLLSSSLVAFAFARMRFRGRNVLFLLVLSTLMLPPQVTLIPTYWLFSRLKLVNTLYPLIIPALFGAPFNIFLLRQYFMTIPLEMDDAARIDGCGWFAIYWRIIVPLSAPAMGVVAIFSATFWWLEFFQPLIYLNTENNFPLSIGLTLINTRNFNNVQATFAMTTIALIPIIALFFIAQRRYVQGIVVSGVKG
ncbi:MAG: carbohydrate ABC transporter permease [Chloroflexales bacterium]|nr:carbohydrate ABC transporter permease [Chloroflexales bacterium]